MQPDELVFKKYFLFKLKEKINKNGKKMEQVLGRRPGPLREQSKLDVRLACPSLLDLYVDGCFEFGHLSSPGRIVFSFSKTH